MDIIVNWMALDYVKGGLFLDYTPDLTGRNPGAEKFSWRRMHFLNNPNLEMIHVVPHMGEMFMPEQVNRPLGFKYLLTMYSVRYFQD